MATYLPASTHVTKYCLHAAFQAHSYGGTALFDAQSIKRPVVAFVCHLDQMNVSSTHWLAPVSVLNTAVWVFAGHRCSCSELALNLSARQGLSRQEKWMNGYMFKELDKGDEEMTCCSDCAHARTLTLTFFFFALEWVTRKAFALAVYLSTLGRVQTVAKRRSLTSKRDSFFFQHSTFVHAFSQSPTVKTRLFLLQHFFFFFSFFSSPLSPL